MSFYETEQYHYLIKFYSDNQITKYCGNSLEKLNELWELTQPQEVDIVSLSDVKQGQKYLVNSPDGYVPVSDIVKKKPKQIFLVTLENGYSVKASFDHLFQNFNEEWIYTKDLKVGESLITDVGNSKVISKVDIGVSDVYDLSVDHDNHRYFTAGVCSHNTGKSLFLMNIALNWVQKGLNVVYISLELSQELCSLRFDAMVTEMETRDIMKYMDEAAMKVALAKKKHNWGNLNIKKLPESGTTPNTIRAYVREYEIKTGNKVDAICVDYLDLLHPNSGKINASDLFIKDKYTSEELRALAGDLNVYMMTASQLNRASVQEQSFDASHIAGGISKINTADNVLAIYQSPQMKELGQYQIQFLKTRSSNGVGSRIFLKFNKATLRITDHEDSGTVMPTQISRISEELKNSSTTTSIDKNFNDTTDNNKPLPKTQATQPGNHVKNLLKLINKPTDF
jgi:KaiC/GvpD/RAD55 family RecA-like ATPase